jgi:predicted nucleotidyltransferase
MLKDNITVINRRQYFMKVAGIITEYNPFHNGHKYHIEEAKRITGADHVIAVMSGSFVQRGTPAIIDKYNRTIMALQNGVDLVLELPVCFATGSAQYFAHGAVSLLDKLGVVDSICFGSECGDIKLLEKAAQFLTNTSKPFDETLQAYLKEGHSYPAARSVAIQKALDAGGASDGRIIEQIINEPNNILGIEYIQAIHRLHSDIKPYTIQRKSAHYHDNKLSDITNPGACEGKTINMNNSAAISSATAIRNAIINDKIITKGLEANRSFIEIKESVPENVYNILMENHLITYPITEEDFSQIIHYRLIYEDNHSLTEYMDVSGDMADRIKNIRDTNCSIEEFYKKIKSKNITLTRINRALLHIILNIRKSDIDEYCKKGYTQYVRVLGLKKDASRLLRAIEKSGSLPIITKVPRASNQLDLLGMRMLSEDINATHLYNRIVYNKYQSIILNEYKHGICII